MKKATAKKNSDELRSEYDLSKLKGGVRGKYYRRATSGTNLVLIEPDLNKIFPDTESVNKALRKLVKSQTTQRQRRLEKTPNRRSA